MSLKKQHPARSLSCFRNKSKKARGEARFQAFLLRECTRGAPFSSGFSSSPSPERRGGGDPFPGLTCWASNEARPCGLIDGRLKGSLAFSFLFPAPEGSASRRRRNVLETSGGPTSSPPCVTVAHKNPFSVFLFLLHFGFLILYHLSLLPLSSWSMRHSGTIPRTGPASECAKLFEWKKWLAANGCEGVERCGVGSPGVRPLREGNRATVP